MKYLLDTNICIYIIKGRPIFVIDKLIQTSSNDIGISAVTVAELEYGVRKSSKPEENQLALINSWNL
jgi:tRNA(fMet)-specific endonuclease VapC